MRLWDTKFSNFEFNPCTNSVPDLLLRSTVLQAQLTAVAASAQEGVANLLGSIQQTLAPSAEERQDPEVKDFRQTLLTLRRAFKCRLCEGEFPSYCHQCDASEGQHNIDKGDITVSCRSLLAFEHSEAID